MSSHMITFTLAASASAITDFNWRSITSNALIIVESSGNLTLNIKNGLGGPDSTATTAAVPYVTGGSDVPVFEYSGTDYTIIANQPKAILLDRDEIGNWLRFTSTDGGSGATVTITGSIR